MGQMLRGCFACLLMLVLMPSFGGSSALAADDIEDLNRQAVRLHNQGNDKQAVAIAVSTAEQFPAGAAE